MNKVNKTAPTPKLRYNNYLVGALRRNLLFALTFDEFLSFWMKPCTYCGRDIETIGLDRVNNSIGYTLENVTPCCSLCNNIKSIKTPEQLVAHCEKIIEFYKKKSIL